MAKAVPISDSRTRQIQNNENRPQSSGKSTNQKDKTGEIPRRMSIAPLLPIVRKRDFCTACCEIGQCVAEFNSKQILPVAALRKQPTAESARGDPVPANLRFRFQNLGYQAPDSTSDEPPGLPGHSAAFFCDLPPDGQLVRNKDAAGPDSIQPIAPQHAFDFKKHIFQLALPLHELANVQPWLQAR